MDGGGSAIRESQHPHDRGNARQNMLIPLRIAAENAEISRHGPRRVRPEGSGRPSPRRPNAVRRASST